MPSKQEMVENTIKDIYSVEHLTLYKYWGNKLKHIPGFKVIF